MKCAALEMTENTQSPTLAACRALNDLVDSARATRTKAIERDNRMVAHRCGVIAAQLDACRTRLVQDGPGYLDTAWAFIDAGRVALGNYRRLLYRR